MPKRREFSTETPQSIKTSTTATNETKNKYNNQKIVNPNGRPRGGVRKLAERGREGTHNAGETRRESARQSGDYGSGALLGGVVCGSGEAGEPMGRLCWGAAGIGPFPRGCFPICSWMRAESSPSLDAISLNLPFPVHHGHLRRNSKYRTLIAASSLKNQKNE